MKFTLLLFFLATILGMCTCKIVNGGGHGKRSNPNGYVKRSSVCASNGVSYDSEEAMITAAQTKLTRDHLVVLCSGTCPCSQTSVCASNGQTYDSEGAMESATKLTRDNLVVLCEGSCPCPDTSVCASNGQTYDSETEMDTATKLTRDHLVVLCKGQCPCPDEPEDNMVIVERR